MNHSKYIHNEIKDKIKVMQRDNAKFKMKIILRFFLFLIANVPKFLSAASDN